MSISLGRPLDNVSPEREQQSFAETALRLGGKSKEEARRTGAVDRLAERVKALFIKVPIPWPMLPPPGAAEVAVRAGKAPVVVFIPQPPAAAEVDAEALAARVINAETVAAHQARGHFEATGDPTRATPSGRRGHFDPVTSARRDPVDCTIYAPPEARPGDSLMVQVWAHTPKQAGAARRAARELDADAVKRGATSLGTEMERGTKLTFGLQMEGLEVSGSRRLVWRGRAESVQFEVKVPEGQAPGTVVGRVTVHQQAKLTENGQTVEGDVPIGEIRFKLKVTLAPTDVRVEPTGEAVRYQSAFTSYARSDREVVITWMRIYLLVGIRCFLDVLNLDPHERSDGGLYRHIDAADLFLLFWSRHAKSCPWIENEWTYCLERRGESIIRPVMLEPLKEAPPPVRLAHLFDSLTVNPGGLAG